MQVQSVNNYNNQPSFGAIYSPTGADFSKAQNKIVRRIKSALKRPVRRHSNQTPEQYYKNGKDIDFVLSPAKNDTVTLSCCTGMAERKNGSITYIDSFKVKTYGAKDKFETSDIDKSIEKRKNRNNLINGILTGILVLGLYAGVTVIGMGRAQRAAKKPMAEKVDSIANQAKTILSDTTKVDTLTLKPIKK